jgi:hypothetical protein
MPEDLLFSISAEESANLEHRKAFGFMLCVCVCISVYSRRITDVEPQRIMYVGWHAGVITS